MENIKETELILNADGSVYHLNLHPEQVASTIITVGDPDRVEHVSKHFDEIEFKLQKREFVTHTGRIGSKRLTVISTGIGTDNIDIVFNELDALFNIDFSSRQPKSIMTTLDFIRIGTSGCLIAAIPVDTFLINTYAIGLDGLMHFYEWQPNEMELQLQKNVLQFLNSKKIHLDPYVIAADESLVNHFGSDFLQGITITATGFYGPQGRQLRLATKHPHLLDEFSAIKSPLLNYKITNLEMETAGIYGLAHLLGHRAISFNALLANRATGVFSSTPKETVDKLIQVVLEKLI